MPLPETETLQLERLEPHVQIVRLNRPEVANAFNTQMGRDLCTVWSALIAEPGDIRCVILTAVGGRSFCAGGDLKERKAMTDAAWRQQHEIFERAFWTMLDCQVPIIAAVNGHAYAGGLELVLAADFAYGVTGTRFAMTEVTMGIMPGVGGTQTLPRVVGERRAREIILTGTSFTAEQAMDWGILNRVCAPGEVMPAAVETARVIAGNAPLSIRQARRSMHFGLQMDLRSALRFEVECYNQLVGTDDRREGMLSFNEKRTPVFTGR